MIGITITGRAYAAIAAIVPAASVAEQDVAPDGEYRLWLPRDVVIRLKALREPGESFSDAILRLHESGALRGDKGS
jgi:hypothetical protein